jgi:HAD superfamily hydrolase (TIGR01509 family)
VLFTLFSIAVREVLDLRATRGQDDGTMVKPAFDLIIFDCDGVLVDSEMLSARVLTEQLAELGIALSFAQFRDEFLGRGFASASQRLKRRIGRDLPNGFAADYFTRLNQVFARELQPMPGIKPLLDALSVPHCVASGSIPPRLDFSIKVTGLDRYFDERVYSAARVKHSKPAPDLFLYAAAAHDVPPSRCLVLEDSEMGVRAGLAAGMTVWHFAGGAHIKAGHALPADLQVHRVVEDMTEIHQLFHEAGICSRGPVAAVHGV